MPLPLLAGLGIVQGIGGALQSIFGGRQAKRAQRELEALQTPTTTSSATISDYYNRASQNPYNSAFFQNQMAEIGRNTSNALSSLQDRRSALQGISSIARAQNDALLRAGASAEQQQWGRLADATRLKASDDERVFNINKMMPFQKKFSMLSARAAGGNQTMNAGLGNLFNAFGTAAMGFSGDGGLSAVNPSGGGSSTQQPMQRQWNRLNRAPLDYSGLGYQSPASVFG